MNLKSNDLIELEKKVYIKFCSFLMKVAYFIKVKKFIESLKLILNVNKKFTFITSKILKLILFSINKKVIKLK